MPVQEDEYGKYIQLTVIEFSYFSVAEYSYDVDVDGTIYTYKPGDIVELTVPEKNGYEFTGWDSKDVTIVDNSFVMIESDVTITAQWEQWDRNDQSAANTGDTTNAMIYLLLLFGACIGGGVVISKKRSNEKQK